MATYKLRFFFDWGGDCLWAANSAAIERFGYPVSLAGLDLPGEVLEQAGAVYGLWLESVENPSKSDREGVQRFESAASELCDRLRILLGPDFEIQNELAA